MIKKVILIFSIIILSSCSISLFNKSDADKMVIMGDSWAWLSQAVFHSYETAIDKNNIENLEVVGFNMNGLRAEQVTTPEGAVLSAAFFANTKNVKYIVLSLAGNDIMMHWKNHYTKSKQQNILNKTAKDIFNVSVALKLLVPDAKIIILGLDYPNFEFDSDKNMLSENNEKWWKQLGEPTPKEINDALIYFSANLILKLKNLEDVHYSNNMGLLQSYNDNSLPTPGNYPDYSPLIGGDETKPTPAKFMNFADSVRDSTHLNKEGYDIIVQRLFKTFVIK